VTQPPQDPGDAPYDGAYQQPPPGQSPNGSSGQQRLGQPGEGPYPPPGQDPYGASQRPYTEPAPAESYPPPVPPWAQPPPQGQPGSAPWAQPSRPYGQPGSPPYGQTEQPYGSPRQPYQAPYQSYPGQPGGYQPAAYQVKDASLADRWQRLVARIIDSIILVVLTSVLWIPFFAAQVHRFRQIALQYPDTSTPAAQAALNQAGTRLLRDFLLLIFLYLAIAFCYDWLLHARWGQTLGKRALGIMVVTAAGRTKISGGAAAGRSAVYILLPLVPLAGIIFSLLDGLWLFWDSSVQCLHDKAVSTVVVKPRTPATAAPLALGRPPRAW
jgi:uncharacterized RDD family membrane protein YckC